MSKPGEVYDKNDRPGYPCGRTQGFFSPGWNLSTDIIVVAKGRGREEMRAKGWYVVDRAREDFVHRGPYKYAETAGAVREEMERHATEYQDEHWNLAVIFLPQEETPS